MTCKEQNKMLDAKIESNVNQYKVDRLNAEMSAFSSGDLNKYEFLKRINSNYKPNLLNDIKDSLARPPRPNNNRDDNRPDNDDNDDNENDDNDDNRPDNDDNDDNDNDDNDDNDYDNRPNNKRYDNRVFFNNLNDSQNYARLIAYQNATIEKLEKEFTDKNNLTQDIIDQAKKAIDESNKERSKYYNKYKNTLVDYTNALEQLNKAKNTYGRGISNLNNTINELRNKTQNLENVE